jgi:alanyl-tRNA synthetase
VKGTVVTERLYYHDSFQKEFEANVVSCEREGDRWKIVLDRTAFYPTSGGQPHDLGFLGEVEVLEVVDVPLADAPGSPVAPQAGVTHRVVHYTSAELPAGPVRGKIDWPRRIDHMQQHTGQHLLSAAFIELFGFQTKSFHLGSLTSTIDLEAPALTPRHLEEAERRTNEIIFEDREVAVRFGTAQELADAGIRKTVERAGLLRAVEVDGFDRQPCGGTHLARTGQAGLLLVRKLERSRNLWRVEYVTGFRALSAAHNDFEILTRTGSLLTCSASEVPSVIAKWAEERRGQHTSTRKMGERLAQLEARELLEKHSSAPLPGSPRLITAILDDASAAYPGILAATLVAESNVVALLASRAAGHVVFAQTKSSTKDSSSASDLGALLRDSIKDFGGKGGGSKDFAQGSLPNPADAERAVQRALSSLSSK